MTERQLIIGSAMLGNLGPDATCREHLTPDALTQRYADNPDAPGGREWEARCARERIGYLEAIVRFNTQELERERARLVYLEGGAADECA